MISLVVYVLSFAVIIGIVASITTFFSNNIQNLNKTESVSAEYNKFNAYMLNYTKNGYSVFKVSEENAENPYITFSDGTNYNTFVLMGNLLYFNKIKLCENIEEFKIMQEVAENGKSVLKTYININGTVYTTDYVME